jgi:hypothetical protein
MRTFATADTYLGSITVHRNHVLWTDGAMLQAQPRKGGDRFTVVRGNGYGYGATGADFAFDDDFMYLTNFAGVQGVFRIGESGKVEMLYDGISSYPGPDLALIGDELYFWTSTPIVYRLTDGEATPLYTQRNGSIIDMVEGAGLLYLTVSYGDTYGVVRIDPATGTAQEVLRYPVGDSGSIAADESGVYVALEQLGAWVRLPHDAPALPDWQAQQ